MTQSDKRCKYYIIIIGNNNTRKPTLEIFRTSVISYETLPPDNGSRSNFTFFSYPGSPLDDESIISIDLRWWWRDFDSIVLVNCRQLEEVCCLLCFFFSIQYCMYNKQLKVFLVWTMENWFVRMLELYGSLSPAAILLFCYWKLSRFVLNGYLTSPLYIPANRS